MEKIKKRCPKTLNKMIAAEMDVLLLAPFLHSSDATLLLLTEGNTDISHFYSMVSSVFPGRKLAVSKKGTVTRYA